MDVFSDFLTIFLGIIVEAFPFIVLGVLIASAVNAYLKEDWVNKIMPKSLLPRFFMVSILGFLMPVCECGNVPVARSMLNRGFKLPEVITFLLAAPIVNPITIWATLTAFDEEPQLALFRTLGAIIISITIGLIVRQVYKNEELITQKGLDDIEACAHDHRPQNIKFLTGIPTEFSATIKLLVFGSFIAASIRIFVPQEIILSIGSSPFLSIIAMIVLAFVVSICANVDAFFASAFAGIFTSGSLLAFMLFGPMVDIKLLSMMSRTFTRKLLIIITTGSFLGSVLLALLYNFII